MGLLNLEISTLDKGFRTKLLKNAKKKKLTFEYIHKLFGQTHAR